jgi:hypothetical protein
MLLRSSTHVRVHSKATRWLAPAQTCGEIRFSRYKPQTVWNSQFEGSLPVVRLGADRVKMFATTHRISVKLTTVEQWCGHPSGGLVSEVPRFSDVTISRQMGSAESRANAPTRDRIGKPLAWVYIAHLCGGTPGTTSASVVRKPAARRECRKLASGRKV